MLRTLVALLLVANLAFWAWSGGALQAIGLGPAQERDPSRAAQQIRPEAVRVLPPGPAAATAAPPGPASAASGVVGSALQCLEAGPFAAGAVEVAERALATAGLPEGSWVRVTQDIGALHAVVLGPYGNGDALQKKREELGRLRMPFELLDLPADGAPATSQPGLALGRYDSRAAADTALAAFNQRGVRTARVVQLRPAGSENRLRVQAASMTQAAQLRTLGALASGVGFSPCVTPGAAASGG
ncbi:MAG: SPOR domain-containing protein [Pseudomonadota bacterium]